MSIRKLFYYIEKIRKLPLELLLVKVKNKLLRLVSNFHQKMRGHLYTTYSDYSVQLYSFTVAFKEEISDKEKKQILDLANLYCGHTFDLLGSGWVNVKHGMVAFGLEGHLYSTGIADYSLKKLINKSNFSKSDSIASLIVSDYQPIDWQIDFKSGFRWSEKTWFQDIQYGHYLGVDVKVPWELARMQHLPVFAWAYSCRQEEEKYLDEFCNQILDFIAYNPPGFGVNWRCTMDVGIRVANWLVAYDMFKSFGAVFTENFEKTLGSSVYDHALHCYKNLEYYPDLCSNHYLSDIAGLLFAAIHIEPTQETDRWMAFCLQELVEQMKYQFHGDGSNFEASTSYHRLSTEIMLYCAIYCLALPKERLLRLKNYTPEKHHVNPALKKLPEQEYDLDNDSIFPCWFWEKLAKACEFTRHITKSSGEIAQFGDNDSGRFLKLWSSYSLLTCEKAVTFYKNLQNYHKSSLQMTCYYDENMLNHESIVMIGNILFALPFNPLGETLEGKYLRELLSGKQIKLVPYREESITGSMYGDGKLDTYKISLEKQFGKPLQNCFKTEAGSDLLQNLQLFPYPDFGVYIYKSPSLYLAVRCGSIGQNGNGGHAHNDQLAIELNIDGKDIISDPGTYLYTPIHKYRNKFRSTRAHFTPVFKHDFKEQNNWKAGKEGIFHLESSKIGHVVYVKKDCFVGRHDCFGKPVYRLIEIKKNEVCVYDFADDNLVCHLSSLLSKGYGKCQKRF